MREIYLRMLLSFALRPRGTAAKAVALIFGGLVFLALIPWLLLRFAGWVLPARMIAAAGPPETLAAWLAIAAGLGWLLWAVWTQLYIGEGTPNPVAPPRKLIVTGPFRFSRNPIQFGVMLYYFGIATLDSGLAAGLVSLAVAFTAGSLYHRLVEEEELRRRFGAEYEEYRRRTPFIIPRLRRR